MTNRRNEERKMQNEARRIEEKDIDPIEFINLGDITKEQKEE